MKNYLRLPRPQEINTDRHFWNAFESSEREVSANWLVSFAQERESKDGEEWPPFTREEIEEFYERKSKGKFKHFWFNGLDNDGHIILDEDYQCYHFTLLFIAKCHQASPA